MNALLTNLFDGFTSSISNIASGLKTAFGNIIYVDPAASTPVVSDIAKFGFIMLGFGMAIGVVRLVTHIIARRGL